MTDPSSSPPTTGTDTGTTTGPTGPTGTVTVWDLPTRLFHWTLVALVLALWYSGDEGGLSIAGPLPWGGSTYLGNMDIHALLGEAVLTLVVFRLLWGLAGSSTARFSQFVRGPAAVGAYLKAVARGETPLFAGHNPAGALMILALLAVLATQAGLGLFANDDSFFDGPLSHLVGKETSDRLTGLHGAVFNLLLLLIALHVAAALYYLVRGENLVRPLVTGRKPAADLPPGAPTPRLASAWRALVLLVLSGTAVWAVVTHL
jgi:cytochrome b